MTTTRRDLTGVGSSISLGAGGSILEHVSDGVVKVTTSAGSLGALQIADASASTHAITKAQFDVLTAGAGSLMDTFAEIEAALGADENYAASISTLLSEVNQDVVDLD